MQPNRCVTTPRARVEHVFGALAQMGGRLVRRKGIVGTTLILHLTAAAYNLKRLAFLKTIPALQVAENRGIRGGLTGCRATR